MIAFLRMRGARESLSWQSSAVGHFSGSSLPESS
jgi:hypothetical protein